MGIGAGMDYRSLGTSGLNVPAMGLVDFEDPETGEMVCVDTSSPVFRREYKKYLDGVLARRQAELRRAQVDTIHIRTDDDLVTPLLTFSAAPHDEIRLLVKRAIDITVAFAALVETLNIVQRSRRAKAREAKP